MMKIKATVFALLLTVMAASSALAATRHVAPGGSATFLAAHGPSPLAIGDPNNCKYIADPCPFIAYAHGVADQGDTILLAVGAYPGVAATDITKDFITISGPITLTGVPPATGIRVGNLLGACGAPEACIVGTGSYVLGIAANNVTIENLSISGTTGFTWAGALSTNVEDDVIGRQVAVLVNGQMASGRHTVTFNASNLPSGMYLYRLSTPTGVITQKMILFK
jgi:hypothetical protein